MILNQFYKQLHSVVRCFCSSIYLQNVVNLNVQLFLVLYSLICMYSVHNRKNYTIQAYSSPRDRRLSGPVKSLPEIPRNNTVMWYHEGFKWGTLNGTLGEVLCLSDSRCKYFQSGSCIYKYKPDWKQLHSLSERLTHLSV